MEPSIKEINDREVQQTESDQSTNAGDDNPEANPEANQTDDSGGTSLPIPSISKTHLALLAVVVVAILVWKARSSGSSGRGAAEMQKARESEFTNEVQATPDGEEYDPEAEGRAVIPSNPNDQLQKDEAALNFLIENGTIRGPS